jgi:hypothetical protein
MPPLDRPTAVHIPRIAWLGLGTLPVAPWVVLFFVWQREVPAPMRPVAPAQVTASALQFEHARPFPCRGRSENSTP